MAIPACTVRCGSSVPVIGTAARDVVAELGLYVSFEGIEGFKVGRGRLDTHRNYVGSVTSGVHARKDTLVSSGRSACFARMPARIRWRVSP